jgi:rhodanese-related sulfurtransferase
MAVKSFDEFVAVGDSCVSEIPAADAVAMHRNGDDLVYLDVRESNEWNLFRIPGALHLPVGRVRESVRELVAPEKRIVVYCARGGRAAQAATTMRELGYRQVAIVKGGVAAWHEVGGELEE